MDTAVKEFRLRRAERLKERGIRPRQYRKTIDGTKMLKKEVQKNLSRMDAPEEETNEQNNRQNNRRQKPPGGGHGNTKLPFGLCQRFGIAIEPGWSPRDAWDALKGEGITPESAYKALRKGKAEKKSGAKSTISRHTRVGDLECKLTPKKIADGRYSLSLNASKDGLDYKESVRFHTKEDMLHYLKDNGVEEIEIDGEKINPQTVELPRMVMKGKDSMYDDEQGYGQVGISNSKGKFVAYGVTFDGKKRKLKEFDSQEEAMQYFKDNGVDESDVKMSGKKSTGPKWSRGSKKEFFEDGGKRYGKVGLTWDESTGGPCTIDAVDERGKKFQKKFNSKAEAVRYLKDQGVEKVTLNGQEINPQEVDIPKTIETVNGKEFQSLKVSTSVSANGDVQISLGGNDLDGRYASASSVGGFNVKDIVDGGEDKLNDMIGELSKQAGVDAGKYSSVKAADVIKQFNDAVEADKKRKEDRAKWEKENPELAKMYKEAEEWEKRRGSGSGYWG